MHVQTGVSWLGFTLSLHRGDGSEEGGLIMWKWGRKLYTHVRYMAIPPGVDKVMSGAVCIIFGAPLVCGVFVQVPGIEPDSRGEKAYRVLTTGPAGNSPGCRLWNQTDPDTSWVVQSKLLWLYKPTTQDPCACYFVQCAQGTTWRAGWNSDYGPHPRLSDSMDLSGIWECESNRIPR